jgi:hypothetical protein
MPVCANRYTVSNSIHLGATPAVFKLGTLSASNAWIICIDFNTEKSVVTLENFSSH